MRPKLRASALATLLLFGCGGNDKGRSSATSSAPPGTVASTTTTTIPAPISYGGATFVTGTTSFRLDLGQVTTDGDETGHTRGGTATAVLAASDQRVTGTAEDTWESDSWGSGVPPGSLVQWGASHLTTEGGTWDGTYAGVYTKATTDVITWWYRGAGGYTGLSMILWISETPSGIFHALIFPADVPPTISLAPAD